jgi:TolA-binding protein
MTKNFVILLLIMTLCCGFGYSQQTWRLDESGQMQEISGDKQSRFALAVSNFKSLVAEGKASQAQKAAVDIKENFPDIVGPEFNAFVQADLLYAENDYDGAVRAYRSFLDTYPNSELYQAGLERLYDIGTAFVMGQKQKRLAILFLSAYEEGAQILEEVADRAGDAPIAKRAMITLAQSYEEREEYIDAYQSWATISSRWPLGELGQDSLLSMAQTMHASYKGPKYDAANLIAARDYYEEFELRYPQVSEEIGVYEQVTMIQEQKAHKDYMVAKYYQRTDSIESARYYYESIIRDWPMSAAAQLAKRELRDMPAEDLENEQ